MQHKSQHEAQDPDDGEIHFKDGVDRDHHLEAHHIATSSAKAR